MAETERLPRWDMSSIFPSLQSPEFTAAFEQVKRKLGAWSRSSIGTGCGGGRAPLWARRRWRRSRGDRAAEHALSGAADGVLLHRLLRGHGRGERHRAGAPVGAADGAGDRWTSCGPLYRLDRLAGHRGAARGLRAGARARVRAAQGAGAGARTRWRRREEELAADLQPAGLSAGRKLHNNIDRPADGDAHAARRDARRCR